MNIEILMEIEDDNLSMPQYLQFSVRSINGCLKVWWETICLCSLNVFYFLFSTISWGLLKVMSIESLMPSNPLILCHPLLLPRFFPASGSFPMTWKMDVHILKLRIKPVSLLHANWEFKTFGWWSSVSINLIPLLSPNPMKRYWDLFLK